MSGQVRIIAGQWRGRLLRFKAEPGLRPTPGRVRETLFNWLGQSLPGYQCLDLFAGSGALGFEALSRGAAQVVMVERQQATARQLRIQALALQTTQALVVQEDALHWLRRDRRCFDLIFLDPPFGSELLQQILPQLPQKLNPGGLVYCESAAGVSESPLWTLVRSARTGRVVYQLLRLKQGNPE